MISAVYIFLLLFIALAGAALTYSPRKEPVLFTLRAAALGAFLLLIANPVWKTVKQQKTKARLVLIQDRSQSQAKYLPLSDSIITELIKDKAFKQQLDVSVVYLGDTLYGHKPDLLSRQTAVYASLQALNALKPEKTREAWVLLTDGIQTRGPDYRFLGGTLKNVRIYPLVLGDTIERPDLELGPVEYNRRTGKGNFFPVEIPVYYRRAESPVQTRLEVWENGRLKVQKTIRLDRHQSYRKVALTFREDQPGWHRYHIRVQAFEGETDTLNNSRTIQFLVVDQRARIAIVYGGLHPDAGVIRRALESDRHNRVQIQKQWTTADRADVIIALQPKAKQIEAIRRAGKPVWWITGMATDWQTLNRLAGWFAKQAPGNETRYYYPQWNEGFDLFSLLPPEGLVLPPLKDYSGTNRVEKTARVLWYGREENGGKAQPLMAISPGRREAVTFGQGLWRWWIYARKDNKQDFIQQMIRRTVMYLRQKPGKDLLEIKHADRYDAGTPVVLSVKALTPLWEPNPSARLTLTLRGPETERKTVPLYYENGFYKAYLEHLKPGFYTYDIYYQDYRLHKKGGFQVTPFTAEKRFTQAWTGALNELARGTGGRLFYPGQLDSLKNTLTNEPWLKPRLSSHVTERPLRDIWWWLLVPVLLLAIEWFYRKARGLV